MEQDDDDVTEASTILLLRYYDRNGPTPFLSWGVCVCVCACVRAYVMSSSSSFSAILRHVERHGLEGMLGTLFREEAGDSKTAQDGSQRLRSAEPWF